MHFVYNGLRLCRKKENGMAERKIDFKPGNMLYPLPVVLVGCADREWAAASGNGGQAAGRQGGRNGQDTHGNSVQRRSEVQHANLFTVAWTGTVCTNPPMLSISVRPERYSYHMIEETGVFTVNLTNEALAKAVDFCGVKSGRDTDKWKECGLTPVPGSEVAAPYVLEAPVSIECRVAEKKPLDPIHYFWRTSSRSTATAPTSMKTEAFTWRRPVRSSTPTEPTSCLERSSEVSGTA